MRSSASSPSTARPIRRCFSRLRKRRPTPASSTSGRLGRQAGRDPQAVTEAVCDRLAVSFGLELAKLVPGRISTEVDADLSFDSAATLRKARALIADYGKRGVARERILIRSPPHGKASSAKTLQAEGIDCNLTLLFSLPQARRRRCRCLPDLALVGRILDWHLKAGGGSVYGRDRSRRRFGPENLCLLQGPRIRTVVMGASFRNAGKSRRSPDATG